MTLGRTEMAEQPLLTQGFRHQQLESKMSRYKRVVIRIQFPDRLVIQGLFRTTETGLSQNFLLQFTVFTL